MYFMDVPLLCVKINSQVKTFRVTKIQKCDWTRICHQCSITTVGPDQQTTVNKKKIKATFGKRSPSQHSVILNHISELEIKLPNTDNSQADFDQLYSELLGLLDRFYPERTITSSDPTYVTSNVKGTIASKEQIDNNNNNNNNNKRAYWKD